MSEKKFYISVMSHNYNVESFMIIRNGDEWQKDEIRSGGIPAENSDRENIVCKELN